MNIKAPRIKVKVYWSEEGILSYKDVVSPHLSSLRELWNQSSSKAIASVLLQSTNQILTYAASITNRVTVLGKKKSHKSSWKPREIYHSELCLSKAHRSLKKIKNSQTSTPEQVASAKLLHNEKKSSLRRLVRLNRLNDSIKRDTMLSSILSSNPSAAHRILKSVKSGSSHQEIQNLKVGDKEYNGLNVPDGFYDSLNSLKTKDTSSHFDSFQELKSDYENIVKICSTGPKIPAINLEQSSKILLKIRASVNDLYSITAKHYTNAGQEGLVHFNFLLNFIISDINNASIPEINSVYAVIIYKGHQKDKTSDRS